MIRSRVEASIAAALTGPWREMMASACTAPVKAAIQDISRNGIALRHDGSVAIGSNLEIDLPDAGGPVTGRAIRSTGGVVAITLNEDPTTLARIDRALVSLSGARRAA